MDLVGFFKQAGVFLGGPATIIFLAVGVILTLKTRFIQFRALPRLLKFITHGFGRQESKNAKTISAFHALFAAMGTSLGMGNIVGPSVAIVIGGPSALFWLLAYTFVGGVMRFTETSFALFTRKETPDGNIISGPTQYLKLVHHWLSGWYGWVMIVTFAVWSGAQANTLANILAKESVPKWSIGLALATIVLVVLHGGASRVGLVASKLVPFMVGLYLIFSFWVILRDLSALHGALRLIFSGILSPAAPVGAFAGASVMTAMRAGVLKSIFITEAGMGTSSIPHSMTDAKNYTDQGILAMYSIAVDGSLAFISGLIVVITGLWSTVPDIDSTLIYTAFKTYTPLLGNFVLIATITLFVITTVIGNSFNGAHSFASLTKHRGVKYYEGLTALMIFLGSMVSIPLVWALIDLLIIFVAVPNVISLAILAFKKPEVLEIER